MKEKSKNYINRELSWLEFNQRVLDLAELEEIPLLERVKFLAITGSNLDEFFKVRVGGLRLASNNGSDQIDISGMSIDEQLDSITRRVKKMYSSQSSIFLDDLVPALAKEQIRRINPNEVSEARRAVLEEVFDSEIAPVVAPIAIERGQAFPLLAGARLAGCVRLKTTENRLGESNDENDERFAIIPIGNKMRRLVTVPDDSGYTYVLVEDVIGMFLRKLFPDQEILEWNVFRMTRNADIALDEDAMHDLLTEMTEVLMQRKVSEVIRLEVGSTISDSMLEFLQSETNTGRELIYKVDGPLDMSSLFELASLSGFRHLKDKPWPPQASPDFAAGQNIFDTIAEADRILIHPYQKYEPVLDFLRAAATDPNVIAIKQTLYRTSRKSEVIKALSQAAANGKQVSVIVELKARFDEERNIIGARQLEQAGVDVIYGVEGLKTHAKVCIVVRREPRGIQRYVHFGTGNYNESTASLYSDVSYFTNDEQLGLDSVLFFNAVTGLSVPQPMQKMSAAPIDLRESLLELIDAEIEAAKQGVSCEIAAKLNSLVDQAVIDRLYKASKAGVKIRLNVRGICCLRPGVKGLSENIEVISIVDRLLEHSRIFHFSRGGDDLVLISSADWMGRNLNRRAELLVPIGDPNCKRHLLKVLRSYFKDNVRAIQLHADGTYKPIRRKKKKQKEYRVQEQLYQEACDMYAAFANPKATVFKAIRGESA